ncbi:MAG: hypothetical protein Kow0063_22450 [Anaerolineae bacterium]
MTRSLSLSTLSPLQRVLLVVLALALFALNTWVVYTTLTSRAPIIVFDFHHPWVGIRAMLRDGANPYSHEVSLMIQKQLLGRASRPGEQQENFVYPLHLMVLFAPFALLPLPVAQALWFSVLEVSIIVFIIVAPRAVGWHPPTWLLALTALFTIGYYSSVWAMILGQISIVVAAFVALTWWGLRTERWILAGVCLALTTVKPQMSFLLVPALLIWGGYRRRWSFIAAFSASFIIIILLPLPWLPDWPLEWVEAANRYAGYTAFDPPLIMLTGSVWVAGAVTVLLLAYTAFFYWRRRPERQDVIFNWALSMLVVISALIAPRTTHVNQLALLLPLFFIFSRSKNNGAIATVEIALIIGLWLIDIIWFPSTSSSQHKIWQHGVISPILPVGLALALLPLGPRLAAEERVS